MFDTTTLPDGSQVKEPGVNMMEIIRQTYGEQVYNAILSRLTGDSSTTTIIDPDKQLCYHYGINYNHIVSID